MSDDNDRQVQLDLLAEEFVERERRGDRPSVAEYAASHPDLAADIASIFPLLTAMESVKQEENRGDLPAGAEIGDYKLLRIIGRGGMGVVYEAEQKTLGRRVALKVLPHMAQLDPRTVERFRVEAQAAARLKHPRIVPVIGFGKHDGIYFYTMQFIDGRGLDAVIDEARDAGSVAPDHYRRAARLVLQAADGIAHAHANGVLHRDVKPSNLMIDKDGSVWITDFGLAKAEDSGDLTRTGDVLGTFRYMAPERFRGESDARGDVYGLGITLYELLTRRRAYEGEDRAAIAAQIASTPPPRPRAHDPAIPFDLETIVRKAMAHDPTQRYATVEALVGDLRAFLDGRPIAARTPSLGYVLRSAVARHKALALTVAAATLLLIGSTAWYVLDLKEKERDARFRQYAATIAAVESALGSGGGVHASALLDTAPAEFRNWEWRHLKARLEPSLRSFESQPVRIESLAYHPTGAWFAATVGDEVWAYDDASGSVVKRLEPGARPTHLRWSPQGDILAMTTREAVEIWSWPEGTRIYVSEPRPAGSVGFAAGGKEIVAAAADGTLLRLGARGGELSRERLESGVLSMDCAPSSEGDRVVLATEDGRIRVLDAVDWSEVWSRAVSTRSLQSVTFLDGNRVASTAEGMVRIWNASDGREVLTIGVGQYAARMVRDPIARRLLVFGQHRIHVFDASTGKRVRTLSGASAPSLAAIHPEGRRLVVGSATGAIQEWYLGAAGDPRVLARHMDDATAVAASPDGRFAASGGFGGVVRLWDVPAAQLARVFFGHSGPVGAVRFSPDGRSLASADAGGQIIVRDLATGHVRRQWKAHDSEARRIAFLQGGDRLVSLSQHSLRSWDLATGRLVGEAVVGEQRAEALAVSHAGTQIATGDQAGRIRIWDARSLAPLRAWRAHEKKVSDLAFHPREALLASVSDDQTLRLWDPAFGAQLQISKQPDPTLSWDAGLSSVAFSDDGSRIGSGSYNGTIQIWDSDEVRLLATLQQGAWVSEIAFSSDGTRLLASLTNGRVRISDSVALRERRPALERAARLRRMAQPLVREMTKQHEDLDERLLALERRPELDEDLREAARRLLHAERGSHEAFVARMWRDLTPPDADAGNREIAAALATGLWRATRHRARGAGDPRCDTLLGVAYYRGGEPKGTLWVFDQIGAQNEQRAPELFAVDLAFAAMSHAALEHPDKAEAHLAKLEALLAKRPALATPRVRGFLAEAREAVRAAGK